MLEQCKTGLVAVVLSETVRDHAPLPSGLRLKRLVCTADEQPDVPPEVKRKVLLALGARIVVKGGEVLVSLDLPLVVSAPPGGGARRPHQYLRVAI